MPLWFVDIHDLHPEVMEQRLAALLAACMQISCSYLTRPRTPVVRFRNFFEDDALTDTGLTRNVWSGDNFLGRRTWLSGNTDPSFEFLDKTRSRTGQMLGSTNHRKQIEQQLPRT